jgi:hypothetical protein
MWALASGVLRLSGARPLNTKWALRTERAGMFRETSMKQRDGF